MSNFFQMAPAYPSEMTDPMRAELTRVGVEDLQTPEQVDSVLADKKGTVLVVVNSVCGCAAGNARPGVAKALRNEKLPQRIVSVFAGVDKDAVAKARSYFGSYPPSSPSIVLLKDGEVVAMLERGKIEGRTADDVANDLASAFNRFC